MPRLCVDIGPLKELPFACVVRKSSTYFGEILRLNFVLLSVVRSGHVTKKK